MNPEIIMSDSQHAAHGKKLRQRGDSGEAQKGRARGVPMGDAIAEAKSHESFRSRKVKLDVG